MKRLLAVLSVLVCTMIGLTPTASAQQGLPAPEPMLRVDVTSMSPRIVSQSDEELKLTARVKNISDVPILNVKARLQLGDRQTTSTGVRQALRGVAPVETQRTLFDTLSPMLRPGESVDLTVVADLRSELFFAEPGVYPLLVNVNGTPENSGEARLAALNLLLPVRALPGGEPATQPPSPQPLSVIWPIASRPRVVADPVNGSVVLADDSLADEMRPGGRLHALVAAAEQAKVDGKVFDALCFAVDPELMATARAMADGYRVRTGLSTTKGTGSAEAEAWLDSLRRLVDGACVLPTPFAGADISSLAARTPALATAAANRNSALEEVLGTAPLPGAIWLTGALTDKGAQALSDARKDLVIGNAESFDGAEQPGAEPQMLTTGAGGGGASSELRMLPYDSVGTLAMTPKSASKNLAYPATVSADDNTIAAQNAVATVLFRATDDVDGPLLLAPPRLWDAAPGEMHWMLRTLGDLSDGGVVSAVGLSGLIDGGTGGTVRPALSSAGSVPSRVAREIAESDAAVDDLSEAMDEDPTEQVDPGVITDPLRNALLRAASTDFQGVRMGRTFALRAAKAQQESVQRSVRISDPGRTIALASGASPIPVSIGNRLPVQVTVQVRLSSSSGLRASQVTPVEVPAGRSRNLKVPAEALRAGRFTVDVELTTPGGTRLGEPTRFELTSTEYGVITVIVTATAAGALLLLAGRRIYRRLRANGAAR